MAAQPQGPQRLNGYTWARDSSAYMKAPSEEIFGKSTICDFLLLVMANSDGITYRLLDIFSYGCWKSPFLPSLLYFDCRLQVEEQSTFRNSEKIQTHSSSESSQVIDLGAKWERICDFPLVTNSNFGRVSYRFRDIDA